MWPKKLMEIVCFGMVIENITWNKKKVNHFKKEFKAQFTFTSIFHIAVHFSFNNQVTLMR